MSVNLVFMSFCVHTHRLLDWIILIIRIFYTDYLFVRIEYPYYQYNSFRTQDRHRAKYHCNDCDPAFVLKASTRADYHCNQYYPLYPQSKHQNKLSDCNQYDHFRSARQVSGQIIFVISAIFFAQGKNLDILSL